MVTVADTVPHHLGVVGQKSRARLFRRANPSRFGRLLLALAASELMLGGSGRAIAIGPVTGRMVLFLMALLYGALALRRESLRIAPPITIGLVSGLGTLALATGVGLLNAHPVEFVFQDLRYSSYFLALPFFLATIKGPRMIAHAVRNIKCCALALSVAYCLVQIGIMIGLLTVSGVRDFTANTADFAPRLTPTINAILPLDFQVFFYSSFVYLGVGVIFFAFEKSIGAKVMSAFILFVLFCTLTRGFLVSLGLALVVYVFFDRRRFVGNLILLMIVVGIVVASLILSNDPNRQRADDIRTETTVAVIDRVTPGSLLWGHGFGSGVPTESRFLWEQKKFRYIHMENAFVEVLHKQGFVGLLFYGVFLVIICRLYCRIRKGRVHRGVANQCFLGTVYIYSVSVFNPYVTNSIGMGFVCMSIAVLTALEAEGEILWEGGCCKVGSRR